MRRGGGDEERESLGYPLGGIFPDSFGQNQWASRENLDTES